MWTSLARLGRSPWAVCVTVASAACAIVSAWVFAEWGWVYGAACIVPALAIMLAMPWGRWSGPKWTAGACFGCGLVWGTGGRIDLVLAITWAVCIASLTVATIDAVTRPEK